MDNRTINQIRNNETKLINEIKKLEQENKKYKEVIDKAIDYLEQKPVVMVNGEPREIYVEDDNKLLKILKGEPNNENRS